MIKDLIKGTTVYITISAVMTAPGATASDINTSMPRDPLIVEKLIYPTSPTTITQLSLLDEIILHYEGEEKILEAEQRLEIQKQQTIELTERAEQNLFVESQVTIDKAISELFNYVDVTPYGFGTTPEIWDCSGLTKWYLAFRDIEVEHSATSQTLAGRKIDNPIAGDLVSFQKDGESDYFHIGVYVGGGMMIHASNPVKNTNLQSVQEFANTEDSKVVYVRY